MCDINLIYDFFSGMSVSFGKMTIRKKIMLVTFIVWCLHRKKILNLGKIT